MSAAAPLPYQAPWETQFRRYSTQLFTLSGTTPTTRSITAPDGQWWRPIYAMVQYQTDAVAGDRVMEWRVVPGNGGNVYVQPANAKQTASVFMSYVWGVGASAAAQTAVAQFSVSVQSIPDMIWPPATGFFMIQNGADAGDAWHTDPGLAVEVYTEEYNADTGVTQLVPTPLIA